MAALAADRHTSTRADLTKRNFKAKMAANAICYQGGMVSVSATGFAKASSATQGERVIGLSKAQMDNTGGADGALSVEVETGPAKLNNDGVNPVLQADVGRVCYVKDDNTVQTAAGGGNVIAGRVDQIDDDGGVWVCLGDLSTVDGKNVDAVPDNNATPGMDVVHIFNIANTGANSDNNIVVPEKFEVLDVTVIKSGAGAGNTVQIQTGAGVAISDAIAAAVDKAVTRAGSIDITTPTNVIAAGGTLRAHVAFAAGSTAMKVIVTGRKAV